MTTRARTMTVRCGSYRTMLDDVKQAMARRGHALRGVLDMMIGRDGMVLMVDAMGIGIVPVKVRIGRARV